MKKLLLAAVALMVAPAASAAIVTVKGSFVATNWFVNSGTPGAPIDPLFMTYSATFDDTLTYDADPSVLTIGRTNVPYAVNFSAAPGGALVIATYGGASYCVLYENSFCAFVYDYTTGVPGYAAQAPAGAGDWQAGSISAMVPEPASWALMIAGFGLVGGALRRRPAALTA